MLTHIIPHSTDFIGIRHLSFNLNPILFVCLSFHIKTAEVWCNAISKWSGIFLFILLFVVSIDNDLH